MKRLSPKMFACLKILAVHDVFEPHGCRTSQALARRGLATFHATETTGYGWWRITATGADTLCDIIMRSAQP